MKSLITFVTVLALASCNLTPTPQQIEERRRQSESRELDSTSQFYDKRYRIYTLEGCQYIVVDCGNQKWGTHKGNCSNPIHQNKKD